MRWDRRPLKPESDADKKLAETPNGMRVLLNRLEREHTLTRHIFSLAEYQGLSGEDKYTMLAYHALLQLERYEKVLLNGLSLRAERPVYLLPIGSASEDDKRDAARYRYLRVSFTYSGCDQHRLHWYLPHAYGHDKTLAQQLDDSVDAGIAAKS